MKLVTWSWSRCSSTTPQILGTLRIVLNLPHLCCLTGTTNPGGQHIWMTYCSKKKKKPLLKSDYSLTRHLVTQDLWWRCMKSMLFYLRCNEHELGQTPGDGEGQGGMACKQSMGSQRVRHNWVTEKQHNFHTAARGSKSHFNFQILLFKKYVL